MTAPVVYLVDDDQSFLRAVTRRLEAAGLRVAGFGSAEAFLKSGFSEPGCVVVDLRLGDQSGLDVQEAISKSGEPLPVIFLTGHGDVHSSVRAMKRGAVDFLTKPVSGDELVQVVQRAIELDTRLRAERRAMQELRERYERLTPREREVCVMVARGMPNKQIAAALGTAERTVKAHRARVMAKMGAQSVADLAIAVGRLALT